MSNGRETLLPGPLKTAFLDLMDPVAELFVRAGIQPNTITVLSLIVLVGSGAAFALGELRLGASWLLLSGLLDLIDGKVARRAGQTTKFGAFMDSTLDRLGEAALFSGIGIYFVTTRGQHWPILGLGFCLAALAGGFLVSYARARAEGLGLDCRVGIAQRPERILGIGVPTLFFHAGPRGMLLLTMVALLALLSGITVVQRIAHVYRITRPAEQPTIAPAVSTATSRPAPALADVAKGS